MRENPSTSGQVLRTFISLLARLEEPTAESLRNETQETSNSRDRAGACAKGVCTRRHPKKIEKAQTFKRIRRRSRSQIPGIG